MESLGEEGVGNTLVAVAVGGGVSVAVPVAGMAGASPAEEQAVIKDSITRRNRDDLFSENMRSPSYFNTKNGLPRLTNSNMACHWTENKETSRQSRWFLCCKRICRRSIFLAAEQRVPL
jgi:hypothetical protein